MKTFTVAGTSKENGELKFRVANDLAGRIAMLERCENTDIQLIQLPTAMTREAAAAHLLESPFCTPDARALLQRVAAREPAAAPKPKAAKERAVKPAQTAVAADDDGFVEPTDERIQVAMSRLARLHRGLTAAQLYKQVMLTHKEFGDYEPNF
jgi:hypothetical protein